MKRPVGGFRPAFNVRFATASDSLVIVGVAVNNQGSDGGLMEPMVSQVKERFHETPNDWPADGGFTTTGEIEERGNEY